MFNAEVLSKFPVVQHFPFGSLFSWELDPEAPPAVAVSRVPLSGAVATGQSARSMPPRLPRPPNDGAEAAPGQISMTKAPWAS